jgi:hypothetical protein
MAYQLEKWFWTEADSDQMGWYGTTIYAMQFGKIPPLARVCDALPTGLASPDAPLEIVERCGRGHQRCPASGQRVADARQQGRGV